MNITDAIDTIEACAGFTDTTTPVGEAWEIVKEVLQEKADLSAAIRACIERAAGRYTEWGGRAEDCFDILFLAIGEDTGE